MVRVVLFRSVMRTWELAVRRPFQPQRVGVAGDAPARQLHLEAGLEEDPRLTRLQGAGFRQDPVVVRRSIAAPAGLLGQVGGLVSLPDLPLDPFLEARAPTGSGVRGSAAG